MPEHYWVVLFVLCVFLGVAFSDEDRRVMLGFFGGALLIGALLTTYCCIPKKFDRIIEAHPNERRIVIDNEVILKTETDEDVIIKKEADFYFGGLIKDEGAGWVIEDSSSNSSGEPTKLLQESR